MKEVHIDLYREHLEEASFLYQQRLHLLTDPDMPWTALHDFEQRLEAHLDALVVGAELALGVCRAQAAEGDAGELFAAVCVFCRQLQAPLLAEALNHEKAAEPERAQALADALKHELPPTWGPNCLRALEHGRPALQAVLAEVIGHRRIASDGALVRVLRTAPEAARPALLHALGRTHDAHAGLAIHASLPAPGLPSEARALQALLRLRDPATLQTCQNAPTLPAEHAPWLALGAGRRATSALLAWLEAPAPCAEVVQALGLLGDLSTVRPLLRLLSHPELAADAALALHVITGAPLFEEVPVPNEVEDDERLDGEAAFGPTGTAALAEPQTPGSTVRRLTQDPSAWEAWVATNARRFAANRRFRVGEPFSPAVLLQCLASNTYPKAYRAFVADELCVGYAIELPFETDMTVLEQQRAMRQAAPEVTAASTRFEPGRWYVDGVLCELT